MWIRAYVESTPYWTGAGLWGFGYYPYEMEPVTKSIREDLKPSSSSPTDGGDLHLRSCGEIVGYKIHANADHFGHIKDFYFDADTWKLRYFLIDTISFWPSKNTLMPPEWIREISWARKEMDVPFTKEEIKNAPAFDANKMPEPADEKALFDYYESLGFKKAL